MKNFAIKVTPAFEKQAKKLMTSESLEALFDYLHDNPEKGDVVQGTGGVRKLRWRTGKDNKGKSGGVRILYHYSKGVLIILITAYGKSNKENITQAERNDLKELLPKLIVKYKGDL